MKKVLLFSSLILLICLFLLAFDKTKSNASLQEESVNETTIESNAQEEYKIVQETDDVVYATDNVNLRTKPSMDSEAVLVAVYGNSFKRTGITENGWYRFCLTDGTIAYSLGVCYSLEQPESKAQVSTSGNRVQLPVAFISQLPELPSGCEITSLAMVFQYLGYEVNKETLSDTYLPKGPVGVTDFNNAFVGNPRDKNGYGSYANAIVTAANSYLSAVKGTHMVYNMTGYTKEALYNEVKAGVPIIIWGTINNTEPYYTSSWIVNGQTIRWLAGEHCFVLIGYDTDKNTVIVNDPLNGIMEYDSELFFIRYQQMFSQAIAIK